MASEPIYKNKTPEKNTSVRLVLWILLFFPVGIYKMWSQKAFSPKTRWIITGAFGLFIVANYSSNYEKYKKRAAKKPVSSLGISLEQRRKSANIERLSTEIQVRLQDGKNPFEYAVSVEHLKWRNHDLLVCNVNGSKGNCGLYEVIKEGDKYRSYWINGKGKQKLGRVLKRTPSSIDASAAYKAATK